MAEGGGGEGMREKRSLSGSEGGERSERGRSRGRNTRREEAAERRQLREGVGN